MRTLLTTSMVFFALAGRPLAETDHDEARRAYEAREIVALGKVLDAAQSTFEGEIVEVELEQENGRWIYEVELLAKDGRILELKYDAKTARLETTGDRVDAARKVK